MWPTNRVLTTVFPFTAPSKGVRVFHPPNTGTIPWPVDFAWVKYRNSGNALGNCQKQRGVSLKMREPSFGPGAPRIILWTKNDHAALSGGTRFSQFQLLGPIPFAGGIPGPVPPRQSPWPSPGYRPNAPDRVALGPSWGVGPDGPGAILC